MAANETTEDKMHAFKVEQYLDMRFTQKEAEALARATQQNGFSLDYKRVRKVLAEGCSHKLAVQIFS